MYIICRGKRPRVAKTILKDKKKKHWTTDTEWFVDLI